MCETSFKKQYELSLLGWTLTSVAFFKMLVAIHELEFIITNGSQPTIRKTMNYFVNSHNHAVSLLLNEGTEAQGSEFTCPGLHSQ